MVLTILIPAVAALLAVVLGILVYQTAFVAPAFRRIETLVGLHDEALGGKSGAASVRIDALERTLGALGGQQERQERRLGELERLGLLDVSLAGFVRFNAYDDVGSDLSYALALLNREGNGIVLSSLYSRSDTRTYGKDVRNFVPTTEASEEELRAIARAREVSPSAQIERQILH